MRFKIKLRKTDRLWTEFIRKRDNYTCQRCGRIYSPDNCRNLGVSHYWSRGKSENTRFDGENCIALCTLPCHALWGQDERHLYIEFMKRHLGQKAYDLLELRANIYKKRDDKADAIIIKHMLLEKDRRHKAG